MIDIAIIGKGPAGWSCAMTARMRGLSAAVIAPLNDSGLLRSAERIDNYPGMPQVSGVAMLDSFRSQALELGAVEKTGLVRQIMPMGDSFMLLVENDVLEAKTVVLAMGAARAKLLPGEEEQIGQGRRRARCAARCTAKHVAGYIAKRIVCYTAKRAAGSAAGSISRGSS